MTEQKAAKNRCDWTKKQIVEYKNSSGSSELSSACNMLYTCIIFLFEILVLLADWTEPT